MLRVSTQFRKFAVAAAGALLFGYLALLLVVAYEGQSRLTEHRNHELTLRVDGYAHDLHNFFARGEVELKHMAEDKTLSAFYANKASGMSMEYGLGASLHKVYRLLRASQIRFGLAEQPVFNRIALLNPDGSTLSDTQRNADTALPMPRQLSADKRSGILSIENDQGLALYQFCTLLRNEKIQGVLVAELNIDHVRRLLSGHELLDQESRLLLSAPNGSLQAWNSFQAPPSPLDNHLLHQSEGVPDTQLTIQAVFEPLGGQDLFTSKWFIAGIIFLGFPVVLGFLALVRFNNRNLVLQTEISLSAQQKERLAQKNRLLQREVQKRLESEKQLAYQATHDTLTSLPNRKAGQDALNRAIYHAERSGKQVLLMFIDLDNFKHINDSKGHHHGDQLLVQSAKRLSRALRSTDTVARFGGDEFLIILPNVPDHNAARSLATDLLRTFDRPFEVDDESFYVSTSIGMALYPQDGTDAKELIQSADAALYRVKEAGRNGFSFYDASMNEVIRRRLLLDAKLRQAIDAGQLDVHYQPILDLRTERIVGAEALVRWQDPDLGYVGPDEFIPLAERNGLIHQLGDKVLAKACQQMVDWQAISPLQLAVNVSSVQFRHGDLLIRSVQEALAHSGLPAHRLELEITESLLIDYQKDLVETLQLLSDRGIQLAIDDFGTGYSALSYLQKLPFNKLKIDRAFLKHIDTNLADRNLVKAILAMAKALDLTVVAEGIEDPVHGEFLRQFGCHFGQGFYYSKPLPADDFERLLLSQVRCEKSA